MAVLGVLVSGCNTLSRLSEMGEEPELSQITNPTARKDYRPVSMPMPTRKSLGKSEFPVAVRREGLFKDHRAKEIGDILTVKLSLADSATLENKTERDRDDREDRDLAQLAGLPQKLIKNHLTGANPADLVNFGGTSATNGDGTIERKETVALTFAAVITQILPNGAMVINGRQEVRVNYELRELLVTGVIRPEDIASDNTISHEKIAEMRVAYGGRGTISDLQQPRWGFQLFDILYPFWGRANGSVRDWAGQAPSSNPFPVPGFIRTWTKLGRCRKVGTGFFSTSHFSGINRRGGSAPSVRAAPAPRWTGWRSGALPTD